MLGLALRVNTQVAVSTKEISRVRSLSPPRLIEPELLDGSIKMGCRNSQASSIERSELFFENTEDCSYAMAARRVGSLLFQDLIPKFVVRLPTRATCGR